MVLGHRQLGLPEHVLVVLAQPRAAIHRAVVLSVRSTVSTSSSRSSTLVICCAVRFS